MVSELSCDIVLMSNSTLFSINPLDLPKSDFRPFILANFFLRWNFPIDNTHIMLGLTGKNNWTANYFIRTSRSWLFLLTKNPYRSFKGAPPVVTTTKWSQNFYVNCNARENRGACVHLAALERVLHNHTGGPGPKKVSRGGAPLNDRQGFFVNRKSQLRVVRMK